MKKSRNITYIKVKVKILFMGNTLMISNYKVFLIEKLNDAYISGWSLVFLIDNHKLKISGFLLIFYKIKNLSKKLTILFCCWKESN